MASQPDVIKKWGRAMKVDILIENGLVIDPYLGTKEVRSVAVKGNKIVNASAVTEANQTVDASGCIVSPGLIDYHGHFAHTTSDLGANPEMICFPTGVTTYVDAGTTGVANYLGFRASTMASKLKAYALLHINPAGIATIAIHESQDPNICNDEKVKQYMELYVDQIKGLKMRASAELLEELGLKPLEHLRALADEIGCPVVVHTTNAPCEIPRILDLLRPGDVYCHVFQGEGCTIIAPDGKVYPEVYEAQKRGILFDACNGKCNFGFNVAEPAIRQGFVPDIISSDMSAFNAFTRDYVFSLPFIMSKYLMLGLDVETIYRCVVLNPAKSLGLEKELGSLLPGTTANISVQRIIDKETRFMDALGESRIGKQVFRTEMTVCEGWIVFRTIEI